LSKFFHQERKFIDVERGRKINNFKENFFTGLHENTPRTREMVKLDSQICIGRIHCTTGDKRKERKNGERKMETKSKVKGRRK
jgi:hypothetical protein